MSLSPPCLSILRSKLPLQGLSFADTHTGTSGTVKLAKKDSATAPVAKKPAAKACLPHLYQCSHANTNVYRRPLLPRAKLLRSPKLPKLQLRKLLLQRRSPVLRRLQLQPRARRNQLLRQRTQGSSVPRRLQSLYAIVPTLCV